VDWLVLREVVFGHRWLMGPNAVDVTRPSSPISEEVEGACEILGLDPLYVANEGRLIAIVAPEEVEAALAALRSHPLGKGAVIIGGVTTDRPVSS
jgi:hydrogenase expression/formation protein HypE